MVRDVNCRERDSGTVVMSGKETQVFSGDSNEDLRLGDLGYEQGVFPSTLGVLVC